MLFVLFLSDVKYLHVSCHIVNSFSDQWLRPAGNISIEVFRGGTHISRVDRQVVSKTNR
jgi:hypothetical protein